MTRQHKAFDPDRAALDKRLAREERENPSGHGQQVTPQQQRETAQAEEHDDDPARAKINPDALKDLKD